ncbi:hypothetical protein [Neorhizobium sp. T25_13]|uniref:hypothetical protein n=1 Tax=Neorhizobium sp. T25_13 TaxID=2093830 RepID=UPI00155E50A1|nr:hypothetical protein [Neorhizobium sp. T25_13]
MDEIRDIFESDELREAVRAIEDLIARGNLIRGASDQKTFRELALGNRFHASEILRIMLGEHPVYPGLREVLAAGFVGWVLFPDLKEVRYVLMIQEVLWHLDGAERRAGLVTEKLNIERDIVARYVLTSFDFLKEIYSEFGGYEAFTRINNIETMNSIISVEKKTVETIVRALLYLHHGADLYRDIEYDFAPSLNRAVTILSELKKVPEEFAYRDHFVSRSLLHRRWSETKQTLALVYAASTIRVGRTTLLQIILNLQFSYGAHSKFLQVWVGRARYVSDHVFGKMGDEELQIKTEQLLADIQPQPFKTPALPALETKILTSQFRKKFKNNPSN